MKPRILIFNKSRADELEGLSCATKADCDRALTTDRDQLLCCQVEGISVGALALGPLEQESKVLGRNLGVIRLFRAENGKTASLLLDSAGEEFRHLGFEHVRCQLEADRYMEATALQDAGFRYFGTASSVRLDMDRRSELLENKNPALPFDPVDREAFMAVSTSVYERNYLYNDPFFDRKEINRMHESWVTSILENPDAIVLTVKSEGSLAGILAATPEKDGMRIELIAVALPFRGKGLATGLIAGLLERIDDSQYPILASTEGHNFTGLALYCKLGFRPCDLKINFCVRTGTNPR